MKPQGTVLVVEDDEAIRKLLTLSLQQEGYKTLIAKDRQSAMRELKSNSPDVILLDLGLPDGDGKELIQKIRSELNIPIIVVSARQEEKEIIASLDMGADDYVTKPFSPHELMARVRSTQRRFMGLQKGNTQLTCGRITIDTDQFSAVKNGIALKLTPTEFNLLKFFMLHPDQVLTHTRILKEVWGIGYQDEMQYLRTYINSLRKKIEPDTSRPKYIHTELGVGYRFCCEKYENSEKNK